MQIQSAVLGTLEIKKEEILTFPEGLLGFETEKEYVLCQEEGKPFYWLQAVGTPELAFIVIDPFLILPSYSFQPSPSDLAKLGLDSLAEARLLAIVTIPEEATAATVNLQGPLVINPRSRQGFQLVLPEADAWRKYPLARAAAQPTETG